MTMHIAHRDPTELYGGADPYRRLPSALFALMRAPTPDAVAEDIRAQLELLVRHDVLVIVQTDRNELRRALLRAGLGETQAVPSGAALDRMIEARSQDTRVSARGEHVSVPLAAHGVLLGALQVHRLGGAGFTSLEIAALRDFGSLAALALHGAYLREELHQLAYTDALTGLANRRRLIEELTERLQDGRPFSVLFLDLDGLKETNDTLGYELGDRLLQEVARVLEGAMRDGDLAARLGGDEYVAILAGDNRGKAHARGEALVKELDTLAEDPAFQGRFRGGSVAVVAAEPDDDADSLLTRGGKTMHVRKRARRAARGVPARA
jgi:diguanylate cyclase (GGDEF)-like protein